jgi:hypothetical protein
MGVIVGIDPKNLAEAGWGVIFAHDEDPAVQEALSPLLQHRRAQASQHREHYYREYLGEKAYRPGESKQRFLARQQAGPGPADPDRVPYYLLIVGSPEKIPYRFQSQLDVQYAVGRVHFTAIEEYAAYAASVLQTEREWLRPLRRMAVFGVTHPDDFHTQMMIELLTRPLIDALIRRYPDWRMEAAVGAEAKKARLADLLHRDEAPSLLVAMGHGMAFPSGDPRQRRHQGALLCADWPGPKAWKGAIPPDFYFTGDDLASNARLRGLIALFFTSYSGGASRYDEFAEWTLKQRQQLAEEAFLAHLPCRMLSHPGGGALAVIGLLDRAWGYSFTWPEVRGQTEVFHSTLNRLLDGYPVGSAFEYFNVRYAELSTDLSADLEEIKFGKVADDLALSGRWTANNDARNFTVIGDPAVRLAVSQAAR